MCSGAVSSDGRLCVLVLALIAGCVLVLASSDSRLCSGASSDSRLCVLVLALIAGCVFWC